MPRFALLLVAALAVCGGGLVADPGVLIPSNLRDVPDPSMLSMERLEIDVSAVGRFARVKTVQVFRNRTQTELEATYEFAMPPGASLSDFAIWEDGVRIPGVILERGRARKIYEELTARKIDPGLLERSEHEEQSATFGVRVFPIPPRGYKRLELEYAQELPLSGGRSALAYPLRPARYRELSTRYLRVAYELDGHAALESFRATLGSLPGTRVETGPERFSGSFEAIDHAFTDDLQLEMVYPAGETEASLTTHREPERKMRDIGPFGMGRVHSDPRGYFLFDVAFDSAGDAEDAAGRPRASLAVSVLFDRSLSMQWEKLERAWEVLVGVLGRLSPPDRFCVTLHGGEVSSFERGGLAIAGEEDKARAAAWVREAPLTGGTGMARALEAGLAPLASAPAGAERLLIVIGDGRSTENPIDVDSICSAFGAANRGVGARVMAFGVGGDADLELLGRLARESRGQLASVAETQDVELPLRTFLDRLRQAPILNVRLDFAVPTNFEMVYPEGPQIAYDLSSTRFVGRYRGPLEKAAMTLAYEGPDGPVRRELAFALPDTRAEDRHLRRIWARERVDHLLRKLRQEGENDSWIDEIVELAREHKLVTPYTSFLAAPRALLRPRVIKPGDPVLRVRTSPDVVSVTAILPFGETRRLSRVGGSDLWETRFLVPRETPDGKYSATLVLADIRGRRFLEERSYRVDSRPPSLEMELPADGIRPGGTLLLKAFADEDTRRIEAWVLDLPPVDLRWDPAAKACTALVRLPSDMAPGTCTVRMTAEDFAHNVTFAEGRVQVR